MKEGDPAYILYHVSVRPEILWVDPYIKFFFKITIKKAAFISFDVLIIDKLML